MLRKHKRASLVVLAVGGLIGWAIWRGSDPGSASQGEKRLPPGASIAGAPVGGLTLDEAREALRSEAPLRPRTPVRFEVEGFAWEVPAGALGPEWDLRAALAEAATIGSGIALLADGWLPNRSRATAVPVRVPAARLRRALKPIRQYLADRHEPGRGLDLAAAKTATEAALGGAPPYRIPLATTGARQREPTLRVAARAPARRSDAAATVTVAAVGDVLFQGHEPEALAGVADALAEADVVFANLEGPLSLRGEPTRCKTSADLAAGREFLFRGPPQCARVLAQAGVSVVSLANNHSLDYGPVALQDTIDSLSGVGIAVCGAGRDEREAHRPAVVSARGMTVAFLAYLLSSALPPGHGWEATSSKPGVAVLRDTASGLAVVSRRALATDIVRAAAVADLVVVSVHGGTEGSGTPTRAQRAAAREAEAAGAVLLVGHHPHVLQPVERVGDLVAMYSLGNFVFPVPGGRDDQIRSAIAFIELGPIAHTVELLPVALQEGRPHVAAEDETVAQAVRRQLPPRGSGA